MPERTGQHTPEQEKEPYYLAAEFEEEQAAGTVYFAAQSLITSSELSVYRFLNRSNEQWYVVVIGEQPSIQLQQQIEAVLAQGQRVTLPAGVLHDLMERRKAATKISPWVEGHYRPVPEKRGKSHKKKH